MVEIQGVLKTFVKSVSLIPLWEFVRLSDRLCVDTHTGGLSPLPQFQLLAQTMNEEHQADNLLSSADAATAAGHRFAGSPAFKSSVPRGGVLFERYTLRFDHLPKMHTCFIRPRKTTALPEVWCRVVGWGLAHESTAHNQSERR